MNYQPYIDADVIAKIPQVIKPEIQELFSWPNILDKFGDLNVNLKRYSIDGRPDLLANERKASTVRDFYEERSDFWAIKHYFERSSSNPMLNYLVESLEKQFLLKLEPFRTQVALRISPCNWDYPFHFDGVTNFMFLLNGKRSVDVVYKDYKGHFDLEQGDVFFIPPFWEHHFWADNDDPPIVMNLMAKIKDDKDFIEAYPDRVKELKKGI